MTQFNASICDNLDKSLKIMLFRYRQRSLVQNFQCMCFSPGLKNARFQRLINGKEARFECFTVSDLVERPSKQAVDAIAARC